MTQLDSIGTRAYKTDYKRTEQYYIAQSTVRISAQVAGLGVKQSLDF